MKETKPHSKIISSEELAAIQASVERAWLRLVRKVDRIHKPKRVPKGSIKIGAESADPIINRKADALWLKSRAGQRVILAAAKDGNVDYFLRLAGIMSGEWLKTTIYCPAELDVFLINHWAEKRDGLPELFYLTPSDLTLACSQHLRKDSLSQEKVVKARQRLGLKAFRRYKIHPKYGPDGMMFPDMDS